MARKSYQAGEETKVKILTASKELFYEKGFEGTLYDDICRMTNVNRALIPYHFKNKADLALAAYDSFMDEYVYTRNYLVQDYSNEEKLIFGILYYYRLLLNDKVARFVNYIISENAYRERLLLGESVMYKKIMPKGKRMTKNQWNIFIHMIWGMEAETCKMIYQKQYEDIHDMGKAMILMVFDYFGYSGKKTGQILRKVHKVLDQYEYQVLPDFTISVKNLEGEDMVPKQVDDSQKIEES